MSLSEAFINYGWKSDLSIRFDQISLGQEQKKQKTETFG